MIPTPFHRRTVLAFCLLVAFTVPVNTADNKAGRGDEVVVVLPAKNPAQANELRTPNGENIVLLVRSSLLTLNDAVQTGNFTVLRDRGSPSFREANSAARLSQIFSDLVARRVDLSVASIAAPKLDQAPVLDQKTGLLHIKGHYPVQPARIEFEFMHKYIAGKWVMYGLAVQVPDGRVAAQQAAPAAPAPKQVRQETKKRLAEQEPARPKPVGQKPNKEPAKKRFPWSRVR